MLACHGNDLVQHVAHRSLLMPLIPLLPACRIRETWPIKIAWMIFIPGFFGVLTETERTFPAAVENMKLNAKNVEEKLIDLVAREQLPQNAKDIAPVRRIETGDVPPHPLLF